MSKINEFLSCKINDSKFSKKLENAFIEARANELQQPVSEILFNGDIEAKQEIFSQSLLSMSYIQNRTLSNLTKHLQTIDKYWDKKAVVYRGSRIPESHSSFQDDYIHTTPLLDIALAYSDGSTNNSTGIGKILNSSNLGFITSFDIPLSTKVYQNFQYEDFKARKCEDTQYTLYDIKKDISSLSKIESNKFIEETQSPETDYWYQTAHNKNYYESPIHKSTKSSSLYLKYNNGLLKLNKHNPEVNQLLARTQESVLRDFYEIQPLQNLLDSLNRITINKDNQESILSLISVTSKLLEQTIDKPFRSKNLDDVSLYNEQFLSNNSYIKNSKYVGSSMDQRNINYPTIIMILIASHNDIKNKLYSQSVEKIKPMINEYLGFQLNRKNPNCFFEQIEKKHSNSYFQNSTIRNDLK